MLTLAILLAVAAVVWPIPRLGFIADGVTGEITAIETGSPAARGGLGIGDVVITFYGYPWAATDTRPFLLPLPWQPDTLSPMTILRDGERRELLLQGGVPDVLTQIEKALHSFLALLCWLTGYVLGTRRRVVQPSLQTVGWFWLALGGALGLYQLQHLVSYFAIAALLWMMCTCIAPFAVAIHFRYPARPGGDGVRARVRRWLIIAVVVLNSLALVLVARLPDPSLSYELFTAVTPYVFLSSFVLSGLVLLRSYTTSPIAHVRRQIRLVAIACVLVAWCWGTIFCLRSAAPALIAWLPSTGIMAVTAFVPLAYLVGGIHRDLLRLDLVLRQLLLHAAVSFVVLVVVALGWTRFAGGVTPLAFLLVVLAAYQPLFVVMKSAAPGRHNPQQDASQWLHRTVAQLGSSLDPNVLAQLVYRGVESAFRAPPLAVYRYMQSNDDSLSLAASSFSELPERIPRHELAQFEPFWPSPGSSPIHRHTETPHGTDLGALVYHPAVRLIRAVRHPQHGVLGLVVLGPRPDGDPYREHDIAAIQQLCDAAGLAFVNSVSYDAQVQAQQLIRELYHNLQHAQERTAAEIARELHDEVLNGNLRMNIQLLHRLLNAVADPAIRAELEVVLEGERTMAQLLRLLCEQLQPAGMSDPLGLPTTIRQHADRARAGWDGTLTVSTVHTPLPLGEAMHRELGRIAREAIANAVKHADATAIHVTLTYPSSEADPLVLTIADDGQARQPIQAQPGHWGLHYMRASATAIDATISLRPRPEGGMLVTVVAPLGDLGATYEGSSGEAQSSLLGEPFALLAGETAG